MKDTNVPATSSGGTVMDRPLTRFLAHKLSSSRGSIPMRQADYRGPMPLSSSQRRLWFIHQLAGDACMSYTFCWKLKGILHLQEFKQAFHSVIDRHEILRSRIVLLEGQAFQLSDEDVYQKEVFRYIDMMETGPDDRERGAREYLEEESRKPFDPSQAPLIRSLLVAMSSHEHYFLVSIDHLAADGWSFGTFQKEFRIVYEDLCNARAVSLQPRSIQYADYAAWEQQRLSSSAQECDEDVNYWERQLSSLPVVELTADYPRSREPSFEGAQESLTLSNAVTTRIRELARAEQSTVFMVLLAGFTTLVSRYTALDDVVIGSPVTTRILPELQDMIGCFVNMLAVRTDLSGAPSFREMIRRTRDVCLQAYSHLELPFDALVQRLQPERDPARNPLFQIAIVLHNEFLDDFRLWELEVEPVALNTINSPFDLTLECFDHTEQITLRLVYSKTLFTSERVKRMIRHLGNLLATATSLPDKRIPDISFMNPDEKQQVLGWSSKRQQFNGLATIHRIFEQRVEEQPDSTAVIFEDRELTYSELNSLADDLAVRLREQTVTSECRVGLCMEKSPALIISMLAVLKAGCAYVPLDPAYPKGRLEFLAKDAGMSVLLTEGDAAFTLPEDTVSLTYRLPPKDCPRIEPVRTDVAISSDALAYIIYTSGSTGTPKGSLITHANVVRLFKATAQQFKTGSTDVWTFFHSSAFDFSTWEIWGALLTGGRVLVVPPLIARSPQEFYRLVCKHKVTVLSQTPSAFRQFVEVDTSLRGEGLALRYVVFGGERLQVKHLEQWFRRHTSDAPELINMYGITETTVHVTYRRLTEVDLASGHKSPIGRQLSDLSIYLLDASGKLVPSGVPGEIYVGGDGVARGYQSLPRITAERFVPDPFSAEPGKRLYRSGDLAQWSADGELEYLGRKDQQFKLHGYRIEPGEIESALLKHPYVSEAFVTVREDENESSRAIAYVVPRTMDFNAKSRAAKRDQVTQWQEVYNNIYTANEPEDPSFNIAGWNSSYTGLPIPADDMREWLHETVERISSLSVEHVLEIGAGTGLLLFRLAPASFSYVATDFSSAAIEYLDQHIRHLPIRDKVRLMLRGADDFSGFAPESFDLIILNSVVQYFPSSEYLERVVESAWKVLAPGGHLFLGDLRNLDLLELFHTSVQLSRAACTDTVRDLRKQIQSHIEQESELLISPLFFPSLLERMGAPAIIKAMPKLGRADNELTKFRYDIVVQKQTSGHHSNDAMEWLDWKADHVSFDQIARLLANPVRQQLGIRNIANARMVSDIANSEHLSASSEWATVTEVGQDRISQRDVFVHPHSLGELAKREGYQLEISCLGTHPDGGFDVCFSRGSRMQMHRKESLCVTHKNLTNNPTRLPLMRMLASELRTDLEKQLPGYMIPSAVIVIDALPLTSNGKVDTRALPLPETRPCLATEFIAPATREERALAEIWRRLLGIDRVGLNDNFFSLGGDSILAIQATARACELGIPITVRNLFNYPTIADLLRAVAPVAAERIGTSSTATKAAGAVGSFQLVDLTKEKIANIEEMLRQKSRAR